MFAECTRIITISSTQVINHQLTSDRITPGDELPQDKSHGINIGLFEGLNVFQVDSGLQDLWGHVPGCAHLRNNKTGGKKAFRAGKPNI